MKKEDSLKPYGKILGFFNIAKLSFHLIDAKKSVWVPDGEGGFDEALIDNIEGDKVNFRTWTFSHFFIPGQRQSRLGGKDFQGESAYASQPA